MTTLLQLGVYILCHLSLHLNSKLQPSCLLDNRVKMASKRRSFISLVFIINYYNYYFFLQHEGVLLHSYFLKDSRLYQLYQTDTISYV